MCSIMEQERIEGDEVARFVQGSLLKKVRVCKNLILIKNTSIKDLISGLWHAV